MGTQVEELILVTRGEAEVERLRQRLEQQEASLARLIATQGKAAASGNDLSSAITGSAERIITLKRVLDQTEASLAQLKLGNAKTGLDEVGKSSGGAGRGLLQFAYILDDAKQFQFGFANGLRAIGNNIPGLLAGLGLGTGVAGVVSIAGSAIALALPLIQGLIESFKSPPEVDKFKSAIDQLKDSIKGLEDKPTKLAIDTFELDAARKKLAELEKDRKAYEAAGESRSRIQRESGQEVKTLLEEAPGGEGALRERLRSQVLRDREADTGSTLGAAKAAAEKSSADVAAARSRLEEATQAGDVNAALGRTDALKLAQERDKQRQEDLRRARQAAEANAEVAVGGLLRGAKEGDVNAQRSLVGEIRRLPGQDVGTAMDMSDTLRNLASNIMGASPAALAAAEEGDREEAAFQEGNRRAKAARVAREKREKTARDEAEKAAVDRAKALAAGALGTRALSGETVSTGDVRDALQGAGFTVTPEEVEATSTSLAEQLDKERQERALAEGIGPEEAGRLIASERTEKESKAATAEERARLKEEAAPGAEAAKQQRAESARLKKVAEEAEEAFPGADKLAEAAASHIFKGGGDIGLARQFTQGTLRELGLGEEEANALTLEALKGAQEGAIGDTLKEKMRQSMVLGAGDLAGAIQGAIGGPGDVQEKSYQELRKLVQLVERGQQRPDAKGFSFK